jgi:CheY-like chemotaxis protein
MSIRIFYVEDDDKDIKNLRASMVSFPVTMIESNFNEALAKLRDLAAKQMPLPNIILLDLVNKMDMAGDQALDILAKIKKDANLQVIPILCYSNKLISASDFNTPGLPYEKLSVGVFKAYKGSTGEELFAIIENILASKQP